MSFSFDQFKKLPESKWARWAVIGLAGLVVALLIFQAGVGVGYRKASFSFRFGDNYYRAFEGGRPSPFDFRQGGPGQDLPSGHGAVGKIIKVSLPSLVVTGPDNIEKVVIVDDKTEIKKFRDTASSTDLKVDQYVVVLGEPNAEGQVTAKFIRLMPPPPTQTK